MMTQLAAIVPQNALTEADVQFSKNVSKVHQKKIGLIKEARTFLQHFSNDLPDVMAVAVEEWLEEVRVESETMHDGHANTLSEKQCDVLGEWLNEICLDECFPPLYLIPFDVPHRPAM